MPDFLSTRRSRLTPSVREAVETILETTSSESDSNENSFLLEEWPPVFEGEGFTYYENNTSIEEIEQEVDSMSTISQMFNYGSSRAAENEHPLIQGKGLVGVEVELEGVTETMPRSHYWNQIQDGSLRNNGKEYVMSSPQGGAELNAALSELEQHLQLIDLDASWRCSTHVHIDVRNMTEEQVRKFILGYTVHELLIFKCSGFHRYKNNFCMPLGFAQQQIQLMAHNWHRSGLNFIRQLTEGWNKYTAINLLPIGYQGSIEFRMSEPKWRKGHLLKLVNRFLAIQEAAISHEGSEEDFIIQIADSDFASKMFKKGLPRSVRIHNEDTEFGLQLAMDVLHTASLASKSTSLMLCNMEIPAVNLNHLSDSNWTHFLEMCTIGSRNWSSNTLGLNQEEFTLTRNLNFLQLQLLSQISGIRVTSLIRDQVLRDYRDWMEANEDTINTILQDM